MSYQPRRRVCGVREASFRVKLVDALFVVLFQPVSRGSSNASCDQQPQAAALLIAARHLDPWFAGKVCQAAAQRPFAWQALRTGGAEAWARQSHMGTGVALS